MLKQLSKGLVSRLAATAVASCLAAGSAAAADTFITMRSGASAGSWYPLGAMIGTIVNSSMKGYNLTVTAGSADLNITDVDGNRAQFALASGPSVVSAVAGKAPFRYAHGNVRSLMAFYPLTLQIVARKDSGINGVADLAGKRISAGQRGFSTLVLMETLTTQANIRDKVRFALLNYGDANQQFQDGQLDAVISLTGTQNPAYTELGVAVPIKLVQLDQAIMDAYIAANPGFVTTTIPAGTYASWTEPTKTLASWTVMLARADRSDDEVYQLVKMLYERREEFWKVNPLFRDFKPENVLEGLGAPLHPGAERYWREIGLLK